LGLAISQQFIKLMGGLITVRSKVHFGTTFAFDIPVSAVDATAIQPVQPPRRVIALEPNQPRYRILIVDDSADNRQLLIKLLAIFDFELKEASNGLEAMEAWSSFEPHLIFMDMWMPVMDGYEATKRIKATVKGSATAIIAVSAAKVEEGEPLLDQMIAMTLSTNPFEIQKSLPPCTNISECVTFTMNPRVCSRVNSNRGCDSRDSCSFTRRLAGCFRESHN